MLEAISFDGWVSTLYTALHCKPRSWNWMPFSNVTMDALVAVAKVTCRDFEVVGPPFADCLGSIYPTKTREPKVLK